MPRPQIRLLFDELLSSRVAKALRELKYHVTHVGDDDVSGTPAKGSDDAAVLDHAKRTNQVVVTSNHDMIMLCAEQAESVVWMDPVGRPFTREEQVVVCFRGIPEWERLLADHPRPVCLRVRRTKVDLIPLDEASRLARQRMKRIQARQRRRARAVRPDPSPPLL